MGRPSSRPHALADERLWTSTSAGILGPLLFASGCAALIYQVLWIKQLSLIVGVEVRAIAIAVSAFFAGLAFGSWVFGRWADRIPRPLLLYAALEIGVATAGVATTLLLARIAWLFAALEAHNVFVAWVLIFVLIGVPPFLMGGTLPVLLRALRPPNGKLGTAGGSLYSANTAGAIAGAVLTPFVLIPLVGVQGTGLIAALINVSAGTCAAAVAKTTVEASMKGPPADNPGRDARLAVTIYSIAGGVALGYEVVWSQLIVQFISTRSFAFAIVLATYLAGLALGAAAGARFADRVRDPWGCFGFLISAAGFLALIEVALLGAWLAWAQTGLEVAVRWLTGNDLAGMSARFVVAASAIVLLPTIILGAAFPLALRLAADARTVGRDVGVIVAFNTIGGILGSILTGFVLVPVLGLVRTLGLLALVACLTGAVAVWRGSAARNSARWAVACITSLVVIAAFSIPPDRLASLLALARRGTVVFYEESQGATIAVLEQSSGRNRFRRLYIQGVSNSGDAMPSLRYMRLQALLPLIVHAAEPRSALVIGLGTGITAGALLRYPALEQRVVAELLPAVQRAAPSFNGNYNVTSDPRLDIRVRDGRRELLRSDQQYDLITLEPPPPAAAGVVNLYSRDFYTLASARLRKSGVVAQWLPLSTQNDEGTRSLVRAFIDVFPHASLWTTDFSEMLLIGSQEPLELEVSKISERFANPEIRETLREVGISSVGALLATWITDRDGLLRYADTIQPVTDDWPSIEYGAWTRSNEIQRVLPKLLAMRTAPPLTNASPDLLRTIDVERDRLYTFYAAGLSANDPAKWAREVGKVMREDGRNPYYTWFTGGDRQ